MAYDLSNVERDFPWASVPSRGSYVEPWREPGSNWFDGLPGGWSDVIHEHLLELDVLVRRNPAWDVNVLQVKEKYGELRVYVDVEGAGSPDDLERFYDLVEEMEEETGRVCCYCGTREGVRGYGGWIRYACPSCEEARRRGA